MRKTLVASKTMFAVVVVLTATGWLLCTPQVPNVVAFNVGSPLVGSRRFTLCSSQNGVCNPSKSRGMTGIRIGERRRDDMFSLRLAAGSGGGSGSDDDGIGVPTSNNRWDDDGEQESYGGGSFMDGIKEWIASGEAREDAKTYTISLVAALLLRFLVVEPRYIPSLSMYPTFEVGDQIAVEKVTKRIRPFDRKEIVVFKPPSMFTELMGVTVGKDEAAKKSKEALIKRIVAVEGDEVKVRSGRVYINGEEQDEPYTAEDAQYEFGPVSVPPGQLLVLGDNRNHSFDGHLWGFLPKKNVIGRAVFTYWPPWRIGNEGMF